MDHIRNANILDASSIQSLIAQLGYPHPLEFIENKLTKLLDSESDLILVYEHQKHVVGLITLHFSVQLAFHGDFATIGYLVVDENYRNLQIGKKLEETCVKIAQDRKCSLLEVYSQSKRADAHRFYLRQGYVVMEKYFNKNLNETGDH